MNATTAEWQRLIADGHGPVYLRIVQALERAVWSGTLRPGQRLPAQRSLASELGVDLTTITRAFNEARKRGLIDARGPLGSFVAPPQVELAQLVDLSMNLPPSPGGSQVAEVLRRGLSSVLTRSDAGNLMTYHVGGGSAADQMAAAQWLKPILGRCEPARLVVTEGAQAALSALLLALTDAGDTVLCEPLVYPGLLHAARVLQRRLQVVDSDEHGMRPDALRRLARTTGARVVYLNPTAQNPTAHTLPDARRRALAEVLRAKALHLLEDDPYRLPAAASPPPPAMKSSRGQVKRLQDDLQAALAELRAVKEALETAKASHQDRVAELTTAVRLRDQFLAMLSHELRNPLAAVLTSAQVIGQLSPPLALRMIVSLGAQVSFVMMGLGGGSFASPCLCSPGEGALATITAPTSGSSRTRAR